MKLRRPSSIRAAARVGSAVLKAWLSTVTFRYRALGPAFPPGFRPGGRYVFAFWHENVLPLLRNYARPFVHVLISDHADGELIAEVCKRWGFSVVRGSSTRGGLGAVRRVLALPDSEHVGVTPDGPRGPRRVVKPGVAFMASRCGMPVIPAGIAFASAWRVNSWDKFALPKPFSDTYCVSGEAVEVPRRATSAELERHTARIQVAMDAAQAAAEAWAGGQSPRRASSFSAAA